MYEGQKERDGLAQVWQFVLVESRLDVSPNKECRFNRPCKPHLPPSQKNFSASVLIGCAQFFFFFLEPEDVVRWKAENLLGHTMGSRSSTQDSQNQVIISGFCGGRRPTSQGWTCRLANALNCIFEEKVTLQTGQSAPELQTLTVPTTTTHPFPHCHQSLSPFPLPQASLCLQKDKQLFSASSRMLPLRGPPNAVSLGEGG